MKNVNQILFLSFASLIGLTACEGFSLGGDSDGNSSTATGGTGNTAYYPNPYAPVNTSTAISGTAASGVVSGNTVTNYSLGSASGNLNPATKALDFTSSATGLSMTTTTPTSSGVIDTWTDGTKTVQASNVVSTSGSSGSKYVREYAYSDSATNTSGTLFLGFATDPAHMPTGGTATYTGTSGGLAGTGTTASATRTGSFTGTSQVTANFGAGTLNAVLSGTQFFDGFGNATTSAGVGMDTLSLSGATISGSSFSGGTLTASLGGADVTSNLIGTPQTTTTSGNFYGWDNSAGAPEEVAGASLVTGSSGILAGSFIASE